MKIHRRKRVLERKGMWAWRFVVAALLLGLVIWLYRRGSHFHAERISRVHLVGTSASAGSSPGHHRGELLKDWHKLMEDSAMRESWKGLLLQRPGLGDTLRLLEKLDSTGW